MQLYKACGAMVPNEFLKTSSPKLINILTSLFNLVLQCGKSEKPGHFGMICPQYKGRGDTLNVDNCRGITILSCIGMLFPNVMNNKCKGK